MARRRANHEGTVQQLPNGKYRGILTIDGKRRSGPSVERRSEALPAARSHLLKPSQPSQVVEETVDQVFSLFLGRPDAQTDEGSRIRVHGSLRVKLAVKTYTLYRSLFFTHVKPHEIAQAPASSVTAAMLADFIDSRALATNSKIRLAEMMLGLLARAGHKLQGYKKPTRDEPGIVILTADDQRALRALALQTSYRLWLGICLCLDCGLRRGEACGLQHEHRVDDGILVVQQIIEDGDGRAHIDDPKTATSKDWVPLPPWLIDQIGVTSERSGFVMQISKRERPYRPNNFGRDFDLLISGTRFAKIMDSGGDVRAVNLHDLRHTYCVNLLEAGVEVTTVAELLRNSVQMVVKVYSRVRRDRKREAIARMFEGSA